MATTVHEPPHLDPRRVPDHANGGGENLVPADGDRRLAKDIIPAGDEGRDLLVFYGVHDLSWVAAGKYRAVAAGCKVYIYALSRQ